MGEELNLSKEGIKFKESSTTLIDHNQCLITRVGLKNRNTQVVCQGEKKEMLCIKIDNGFYCSTEITPKIKYKEF